MLILFACSGNSPADEKYAAEVMDAFQLQENQYKMAMQHALNDSAAESMGHGMGIMMWSMSLFEMSEILSELDTEGVNSDILASVAELIQASNDFVDLYSNADSSTLQLDIAVKGDRVQKLKSAVKDNFLSRGLISED